MPIIHHRKSDQSFFIKTRVFGCNNFCTFQITKAGLIILKNYGFLKENSKISPLTLDLLKRLDLIFTNNSGIQPNEITFYDEIENVAVDNHEGDLIVDLKKMLEDSNYSNSRIHVLKQRLVKDKVITFINTVNPINYKQKIKNRSNKVKSLKKKSPQINSSIQIVICPYCATNNSISISKGQGKDIFCCSCLKEFTIVKRNKKVACYKILDRNKIRIICPFCLQWQEYPIFPENEKIEKCKECENFIYLQKLGSGTIWVRRSKEK